MPTAQAVQRTAAGERLDRLNALLRAELELGAELRPLMLSKQRALVANRVDELARLTDLELLKASQFAAAESARAGLCRELASLFGLAQDMALAPLLDRLAGEPLASETARLSRELKKLLTELGVINDDNRHLAQNLLDYTSFVTRLISCATGEAHYGRDGRVAGAVPSRRLLDDKL